MMHPIAITLCLIFLQESIYAKGDQQIYQQEERRAAVKDLFSPQINYDANWQKGQQEQEQRTQEVLRQIEQQKAQAPVPAPLKPTGGVLPPQYLSVFAQCDAINDTSSLEEIQAALTELKAYKDSREVKNSYGEDQYKELAEKGTEPIQRGSYWIVNIPGKIEYYFSKLNELLKKN